MESSTLMSLPFHRSRSAIAHSQQSRLFILVCICLTLLTTAACRRGEAQSPNTEPAMIRTPRPTFTPTPGLPQEAAVEEPASGEAGAVIAATPTPAPPAAVNNAPSGAKVVVNTPLVNARSGPGLDYEVVTIVERGEEFDILAKDALGEWWQVCCVEDEPVWVIGQLVDTDGPVDVVPVFGASQLAAGGDGSAPAAGQTVLLDQAPDIQFSLENQEQFPESAAVRIFMYVYSGNEGLAGYSLWVRKDGVDVPVNVISFGGSPGFTWPFQDARQRSQNWKAEFPDLPPGGQWEVQLINDDGRIVGPPATFAIGPDDTNLELYVRYERQ
jgi:uncharacterized protein YraI